jgi:HEAT repeat protein
MRDNVPPTNSAAPGESMIPNPPNWDYWRVFLCFEALGSRGKSAIPELALLARDPEPGGDYSLTPRTREARMAARDPAASDLPVYLADERQFFRRPMFDPGRPPKPFFVKGRVAAWCLGAIGADAIASLTIMLADTNALIRARATEALAMAGPAAAAAIPALIKCLHDPDSNIRMRAADALGWIAKEPGVSIPAIEGVLGDEDIRVSLYALESIGKFGRAGTPAIPSLVACLTNADIRIKDSGAVALSKVSPEAIGKQIMPAILPDLKSPNEAFRNGT